MTATQSAMSPDESAGIRYLARLSSCRQQVPNLGDEAHARSACSAWLSNDDAL